MSEEIKISWFRRFLYRWNTLPWAKPLAHVTCLVILVVFVASYKSGRDIPPNAASMGKWFGGTIIALAYGKSAVESVAGGKKAVPAKDKEGVIDEQG